MIKKRQSLRPIGLFLLYTFSITYLSWAVIIVANRYFGTLWYGELLFWIPMLIGGLGPAIGVYIIYRQFNEEFEEETFIKFTFNTNTYKRGWLVFGLYIVWRFFMVWISFGIEEPISIIYMFINLPLFIIGGGFEELGWRGYLQPKIEKMVGYVASIFIVGVIWSLWHLPLWLIEGAPQSSLPFGLYALMAIILSFTLTTIYKYTQSPFLSVLSHAWYNGCIGLAVYINSKGYLQLNLNWKIILAFMLELVISLGLGMGYYQKERKQQKNI